MSNKPVFIERGSLAIGVEVKEFKNAQFLDVRNYYDAGGEWKPTAKGLMIPIEHSREVLRAMEDLIDPIASKRPVLKETKVKQQSKPAQVTLYLVSRSKPKFEQGVLDMPASRVFERSSSAKVNARNRTLKSHKSEPYKVFKYEGPEPSVVERTAGVDYCVFEQDAGANKISLFD